MVKTHGSKIKVLITLESSIRIYLTSEYHALQGMSCYIDFPCVHLSLDLSWKKVKTPSQALWPRIYQNLNVAQAIMLLKLKLYEVQNDLYDDFPIEKSLEILTDFLACHNIFSCRSLVQFFLTHAMYWYVHTKCIIFKARKNNVFA
jgi:hypothetical protein